MPPMITDDDASDVTDDLEIIQPRKNTNGAKKGRGRKPATAVEEVEEIEEASGAEDPAAGEDGEEDDEDEEEFVVEKIMSHAFEEDGTVKYEVKWAGYESKADRTWEPEENLAGGASDILAEYHKKIGGKPVPKPATPATKGRGRGKRKSQPAASTPDPESTSKGKRRRTTNGTAPTKVNLELPPGSWEDSIESIQTLEQKPVTRNGKDDVELVAFAHWNDGRQIEHPIVTLRQKCPQKLLDYLLGKLVFKPAILSPATNDPSAEQGLVDEFAANALALET